jgi:FkbM family methyltransferase
MNELERTLMTVQCRDTDGIRKVDNAGKVLLEGEESVQIMHNGLKVVAGGYYGDWMAHVIRGLDGHHEPQEEAVFHRLMRYVRHGTHMVELGSFWAYYTLWFLKEIPHSTATCIEPDIHHLTIGQRNARLNSLEKRIAFVNAWVGGDDLASWSASTETNREAVSLPMMNMAAVRRALADKPIELLHMDIQGFELRFLRSIQPRQNDRSVRFVMISTHHSSISGSTTIHGDCMEVLRSMGATILVEHTVVESFSGDGLILASFYPEDKYLPFPVISKNIPQRSLYSTP